MYDIQKSSDHHGIEIDKVGVKGLTYPISVLDKNNDKQNTIASISFYVSLPHQFKGTHMSRFVEILNKHRGEITIRNMGKILREVAQRLESDTSHMEVKFTYFIEKEAPVTKQKSLMDYKCKFVGQYSTDKDDDFVLQVKVPVLTLCPCSKEISDYGAHNQRSEVTVNIRFNDFVWIEDIIRIVEDQASSELFALLKRPDEKFVTEHSYENPRFVEDMVSRVSKELECNDKILWFTVESENFESIHNHSAYAFIEKDKR